LAILWRRYGERSAEGFPGVTNHLNFSRAAEELLLTQPSVTQQIKALEDEYGVTLFDPSGGRIALTPSRQALRRMRTS
jgi:DNA-binding transcriptional LysR family regulator